MRCPQRILRTGGRGVRARGQGLEEVPRAQSPVRRRPRGERRDAWAHRFCDIGRWGGCGRGASRHLLQPSMTSNRSPSSTCSRGIFPTVPSSVKVTSTPLAVTLSTFAVYQRPSSSHKARTRSPPHRPGMSEVPRVPTRQTGRRQPPDRESYFRFPISDFRLNKQPDNTNTPIFVRI